MRQKQPNYRINLVVYVSLSLLSSGTIMLFHGLAQSAPAVPPSNTWGHIGSLLYRVPAGWAIQSSNDKVAILSPQQLQPGKSVYLTILAGTTLEVPFGDWFKLTAPRLWSGEKVVLQQWGVKPTQGDGYRIVTGCAVTDDAQGRRSYHFVAATDAGDQGTLVKFTANDESLYRRELPSVVQLLEKMALIAEPTSTTGLILNEDQTHRLVVAALLPGAQLSRRCHGARSRGIPVSRSSGQQSATGLHPHGRK